MERDCIGVYSLRERAIRNNVFNKNVEGVIMYNYKFDNIGDDVNKCFLSDIEKDAFDSIIIKINNISRLLPIDICAIADISEYCKENSNEKCKEKIHIDGMIENAMLADEDYVKCIEEGARLGARLKEIDFQSAIMQGLYGDYIKRSEIVEAMKITKHIGDLAREKEGVLSDMECYNNLRGNKVNDFINRLAKFLDDIKKLRKTKLEENVSEFDGDIIDFYREYLIYLAILECKQNVSMQKMYEWFSGDMSKDMLGGNFDMVNRQVRYVGTDC